MNGQGGLDQLLAALDGGFQGVGLPQDPDTGLTKIVLARRSDVKFSGKLDPLALLQALQVGPLCRLSLAAATLQAYPQAGPSCTLTGSAAWPPLLAFYHSVASCGDMTGRTHHMFMLALQEKDPRSYQIMLQQPGGACFLGSTPEQLYTRTGPAVASEAVAATRPRGPPGLLPIITSRAASASVSCLFYAVTRCLALIQASNGSL